MRKAELERQWIALPATTVGDNSFEANLSGEAVVWFALVSDDRLVTVSEDFIQIAGSGN